MKTHNRKRATGRSRGATPTRLAQFIEAEQISASKLSRIADVNVTHLCDLKSGRSKPTQRLMAKLLSGASRLLGREVSVTELFDFGPGEAR